MSGDGGVLVHLDGTGLGRRHVAAADRADPERHGRREGEPARDGLGLTVSSSEGAAHLARIVHLHRRKKSAAGAAANGIRISTMRAIASSGSGITGPGMIEVRGSIGAGSPWACASS